MLNKKQLQSLKVTSGFAHFETLYTKKSMIGNNSSVYLKGVEKASAEVLDMGLVEVKEGKNYRIPTEKGIEVLKEHVFPEPCTIEGYLRLLQWMKEIDTSTLMGLRDLSRQEQDAMHRIFDTIKSLEP